MVGAVMPVRATRRQGDRCATGWRNYEPQGEVKHDNDADLLEP
jgi:hypothetical protein